MSDDTAPDLQNRLDQFQKRDAAKRPVRRFGVGALATLLALSGAGLAYYLASGLQTRDDSLGTSDVETFQDQRRGTGGRLEFPADEAEQQVSDALIAVEEALDVSVAQPPAAPEPSAAVLAELSKLREALAASQTARNAEIQEAVSDLRAAFETQTKALEASIAVKETELANAQRENTARLNGLQAMLDAERAQREGLEAELAQSGQLAEDQAAEARRQQEEAELQRAAEAAAQKLLAAQITSPSVIYAGGAQGSNRSRTTAANGSNSQDPAAQSLSPDEQFLKSPAPLEVAEASRLADPSRTVPQGSVIQAALQTAINSDLPGSVVAVVSEPVPALTGHRILIPRGARLFGQYRAGVQQGQKRILILWTRVLTPDGTSIEIASVGGDTLGRSGLTGQVDTKFAARFGGAALISIIGAAPALASERSSNETTSIVLGDVGSDLQDAVGSVIADQVALKPTIYVDQGAAVTVIVDRDVVIY